MDNNLSRKLYYFLIPLFALSAPLLHRLYAISVTFDSFIKVGAWVLGVVFLVSIFTAVFLIYIDKKKKLKKYYHLLQLLILSAIILVATDLSFGGLQLISNLLPFSIELPKTQRFGIHLIILSICFLLILFFLWLLRDKVEFILFAIFGSIFLSTIIILIFNEINNSPSEDNYNIKSSLPNTEYTLDRAPVIHMVFDELIGAEGIDRSIPGGEELYYKIRDFHEKFGFRLYGKTYSRHYMSAESIPSLLNLNYSNNLKKESDSSDNGNFKYFDYMHSQGYIINIYQTEHINFCQSNYINKCETYPSFDPFSEYMPDKIKNHSIPLVINVMVNTEPKSHINVLIREVYELFINKLGYAEYITLATRFELHGFNSWYDKFIKDIINANNGEYYFAHFLVPHAPLILDKNCNIKRGWKSPYYLKEHLNLSGVAFQNQQRQYYINYYDQISCVYKNLTKFMQELDKNENMRKAVIIIHGDHGSRISSGHYLESLSHRDYIDNYSTHFSIRKHGIDAGYDLRMVSIQRLFAEIFSATDFAVNEYDSDKIEIESKLKNKKVLMDMPAF